MDIENRTVKDRPSVDLHERRPRGYTYELDDLNEHPVIRRRCQKVK